MPCGSLNLAVLLHPSVKPDEFKLPARPYKMFLVVYSNTPPAFVHNKKIALCTGPNPDRVMHFAKPKIVLIVVQPL